MLMYLVPFHADECGSGDWCFYDNDRFLAGFQALLFGLEIDARAVFHGPRKFIAADHINRQAREHLLAFGVSGFSSDEINAPTCWFEGNRCARRTACGGGFQIECLLQFFTQDDLILGRGSATGGSDFERVIFLALDLQVDMHHACSRFAFGVDANDFQSRVLACGAEEPGAFEAEDEVGAGHFKLRGGTDGLLIDVGDFSAHAHLLWQCGAVGRRHGHLQHGGAIVIEREIAIHPPLSFIIVAAVIVVAVGITIFAIVRPVRSIAEMIVIKAVRCVELTL